MKRIRFLIGLCIALALLFVSVPITAYAQDNGIVVTRESIGNNNVTQTVRITNRVVEIQDGAFSGLTALKQIIVDSNNPYYASYNGCLYNKDFTVLMCIPRNTKSVQIKTSIKSYTPHAVDGLTQSRINALNKFLGLNEQSQPTTVNNSQRTTTIPTSNQVESKPSNNTSSNTDFSKYVYTDASGKKCFKYTGSGDTRIIVPDGVEKIIDFTASTLQWNDTVTYIYIPASVKTMNMYCMFGKVDKDTNWYNCLYRCRNLKTVECESGSRAYQSNGSSVYRPGNIYVWSNNKRIPYDENAYIRYNNR